ncbi:MAG: LytTR family transcriptional regulator DNA-binding domain-containing protein [Lachnospiraceae bacterium]|nr:LytTR family transcriptional regulator DNA-binding domain-containing protein [Lachnospiraceae bacterium]
MKIEIDVDEKYRDIELQVRTPALTQDIEKIIALIRMIDMQIAVKREDETILLDASRILFIEAVDRKSFVYTADETFESDLKLYEFEEQLSEKDFIRISKQSILNLRKVKSLKADINRKIRVTMENGEQIIVSRMYSDELRKRLGVK